MTKPLSVLFLLLLVSCGFEGDVDDKYKQLNVSNSVYVYSMPARIDKGVVIQLDCFYGEYVYVNDHKAVIRSADGVDVHIKESFIVSDLPLEDFEDVCTLRFGYPPSYEIADN